MGCYKTSNIGRIFVAVGGIGLMLSACKPNYPQCKNDGHCQQANEVCVNGQCQECREEAQCAKKYPGEGRQCVNARCERPSECTADGDCAAKGVGLVCRTNKCVQECAQDGDCAAGSRCEASRCVAVSACSTDIACGPGRFCDNGTCRDVAGKYTNISASCRPVTAAAGEVVALSKVLFGFDQYDLSVEARSALEKDADCLRQAPGLQVVVEGHCDERGTQEYNLALGEKRAATVLNYLRTLGVDTKRMQARSKGENEPLCTERDEACWGQNRRVMFIQQLSSNN